MDIIETIIIIVGSLFVGWKLREIVAKIFVQNYLNRMEQGIPSDDHISLMSIRIEKHNECLYVYDGDTEAFITQGRNRQELEQSLAAMYPKTTFAATEKNLKEVGFK